MLCCDKLNKSFHQKNVVCDVSFRVNENEIFGIIGADGAGKSTLFSMLCTLLLPSSGSVKIKGYDLIKDYKKIRQIIGYMPGNFSLYKDLSVRENLEFFAAIYGRDVKQNYHLIASIYEDLKPFESRRVEALSGGMKQKLALCCALIHKPQLLFLDEPTTGVDAVSRKEFWDILQILKMQMSIVVSTPYMDEASSCDKIALMHKGRFLKLGTIKNLCESFEKALFKVKFKPSFLTTLQNHPKIHSAYLFGDCFHIALNDAKESENLSQEFGVEFESIEAGMEDCFMEFCRE